EDSFRKDYCRGKSEADCNDLWRKYSLRQNTKDKKVEAEKSPEVTQKTTKVSSPTAYNLSSAPTNVSVPSAAGASSETLSRGTASSTTSAASTSPSTSSLTAKATSAPLKVAAPKPVNTPALNQGLDQKMQDLNNSNMQIKLQSQLDAKMTRLGALNTSPRYRNLQVASPYGTLINVKLQPGGGLLEADRPICDSLDAWRNTSFLTATLKASDPNNEMLVSKNLGDKKKAFLSSENYCIGNKDRIEACKFGEPRASCSCSDYGNQYFLDKCNEMFDLKNESEEFLKISECKKRLESIVSDSKDLGENMSVRSKFTAPYIVSLGEKYLCLDIPETERKACSDFVDKKFASMTEAECTSLNQALGTNGRDYVKANASKLKDYEWFKLYSYYGNEFKELFDQVDLGVKVEQLPPNQCKTKIKGLLEKMIADIDKNYDTEIAKMNPSFVTTMWNRDKLVKSRVVELCKEKKCKNLFSIFREPKDKKLKKKELNQVMVNEMKDITSFFRDLNLHVKLYDSHCPQMSTSPIAPNPQNNPLFKGRN
ncbi:MAG: hypothetical protein KDD37_05480, partial [Bdellovibrionales bacterium]|nr:hypothetical protein [Bdellovibrionales bacterium]